MLLSHIPHLWGATPQVQESTEQCPALHIPAPEPWALVQSYSRETGGCSQQLWGHMGAGIARTSNLATVQQQPNIPVLRSGCSVGEQGNSVPWSARALLPFMFEGSSCLC